MMEPVFIIQQNLAHCEAAEDVFIDKLAKTQAIGLVQEPYLRKNKIKKPSGYSVIYKADSGSRACIYLPTNINAWHVYASRDLVAILVGNQAKGVIIVSSYHDGKFKPNEISLELDLVMDYVSGGQHQALFGMDSNAHSILWGPNDSPDDRGSHLKDWIFRNHLKVDNTEIGRAHV